MIPEKNGYNILYRLHMVFVDNNISHNAHIEIISTIEILYIVCILYCLQKIETK